MSRACKRTRVYRTLRITRRVYDRERPTIRPAEALVGVAIATSVATVVVIAMAVRGGRRREGEIRGGGGCCGEDIILNSLDAATVGGVLSLFLSARRAVLVASQQCETAANTKAAARASDGPADFKREMLYRANPRFLSRFRHDSRVNIIRMK